MFIILSYFFSGRNIFWIRDRIVTLILIHPPPLTPPLSFYPQSQYLSEWGERWHHRRRLLCSCSCLLPIALIITIQSKRNDFDSARAPGCVYVCPSVRMLDSILMKLRPRSAPHANSTHAPTTNDSLMSKPEIQTSSELSTIQQSSPTWIWKSEGKSQHSCLISSSSSPSSFSPSSFSRWRGRLCKQELCNAWCLIWDVMSSDSIEKPDTDAFQASTAERNKNSVVRFICRFELCLMFVSVSARRKEGLWRENGPTLRGMCLTLIYPNWLNKSKQSLIIHGIRRKLSRNP